VATTGNIIVIVAGGGPVGTFENTWTFELRDIVAYVAIESPEKRCGKTTLLSVLAAMAH
jgi:hypothetical protein